MMGLWIKDWKGLWPVRQPFPLLWIQISFYRGYGIEDLVENSSFEEVIFLLWNDRLPNSSETERVKILPGSLHGLEPESIGVLKKLPTDVHPMSWLRSAFSINRSLG